MRVAKDSRGQQFVVLADLRISVQPSASVIQVDMLLPVEPTIVTGAQSIEDSCPGIFRIALEKQVMV